MGRRTLAGQEGLFPGLKHLDRREAGVALARRRFVREPGGEIIATDRE